MRKWIALLLCVALVWAFALPAAAAEDLRIFYQPQNPTFNEYAVASYSVTTMGSNVRCTWYIVYNGTEYDMSQAGNGAPWEGFAGTSYGPAATADGSMMVFTYHFNGIEAGLNGSYIFARVTDGVTTLESERSYISVVPGASTPPQTATAAYMDVTKGEYLDLLCSATDPTGGTLSYIWYETPTGNLADIAALDRGGQTSNTLHCDTDSYGTRYYVCGVTSSNGGSAYTNVIPVTVLEAQATTPTPLISAVALPEATVGKAYYHKLECTDPDATFTLEEDYLSPVGLSLTQHGELEGTPTKAGDLVLTVRATGESGSSSKNLVLQIGEAAAAEPTETIEATVPATEPAQATQPVTDPTETTGDIEVTAPATTGEDKGAAPWWILPLVLVALALVLVLGLAAVVVVILVIILKKKKKKVPPQA